MEKIYLVMQHSKLDILGEGKAIAYSECEEIACRYKTQLLTTYPTVKYSIEEKYERTINLYRKYAGLNLIEYNGAVYPNYLLRESFANLNKELSELIFVRSYLKENIKDINKIGDIVLLLDEKESELKNKKMEVSLV